MKKLSLLDWTVAVATLCYGLYSGSYLFIGAGVLSCFVAWYNPAKRMQRRLLRSGKAARVSAQQQAAAQAAVQRVAEDESVPSAEAAPVRPETPRPAAANLLSGPVAYGRTTANAHKTNVLTLGGSNLYVSRMTIRYF